MLTLVPLVPEFLGGTVEVSSGGHCVHGRSMSHVKDPEMLISGHDCG